MDDKQALFLTLQAHMAQQPTLKQTSASPSPPTAKPTLSHAAHVEKQVDNQVPPLDCDARERVLRLEEANAASDDSLSSLPDIDLQVTNSMFAPSTSGGSGLSSEENSSDAWGLEGCVPPGLRSGIRLNTVRMPSPRQDSAPGAGNATSSLASASPLLT